MSRRRVEWTRFPESAAVRIASTVRFVCGRESLANDTSDPAGFRKLSANRMDRFNLRTFFAAVPRHEVRDGAIITKPPQGLRRD